MQDLTHLIEIGVKKNIGPNRFHNSYEILALKIICRVVVVCFAFETNAYTSRGGHPSRCSIPRSRLFTFGGYSRCSTPRGRSFTWPWSCFKLRLPPAASVYLGNRLLGRHSVCLAGRGFTAGAKFRVRTRRCRTLCSGLAMYHWDVHAANGRLVGGAWAAKLVWRAWFIGLSGSTLTLQI